MNPTRPANPTPAHHLLPAIAAAVLATLLYAVTLGGTYVYDDVAVVHGDPRVQDPRQWGQLWTRNYNGGPDNLYRPLVSTSYALEWWLHGDRPWMFHAVNILLHAAASAAVAELCRRATARPAAAWAAGLLFAAHPVHAEAVANIVGRAELACALPLLASLALLARRPLTPARAAAIIACGAVAVLCKEQGVLAPLLWAGFACLVWRGAPVGRERSVARAAALVVLWSWAAYLFVREHFLKFDWDRLLLSRALQPMIHTVGIDRLLLPVALLGRYTALILWPARLSPDYGGDVIGPATHAADPYLWIGCAALAAWAVATIVASRRRAGFVLFCLLSLAATYAVVGNIVTIIGTIFGERLVYLPSAFLAMLAGVAAARLGRAPRIALLVLVLVPASLRTVRAAAEWNDPHALFTRALADYPGSVQLHLLVAQLDRDQGRPTERTRVLDDACRRFPDDWRPWSERAKDAGNRGDFLAAEADLQRALACDVVSIDLQVERDWLTQKEAAAHWRRPTTARATAAH